MDPRVLDVVNFEPDVGRDEGRLVRAKVIPDDLCREPWLGEKSKGQLPSRRWDMEEGGSYSSIWKLLGNRDGPFGIYKVSQGPCKLKPR